jgi:hypothetical protein
VFDQIVGQLVEVAGLPVVAHLVRRIVRVEEPLPPPGTAGCRSGRRSARRTRAATATPPVLPQDLRSTSRRIANVDALTPLHGSLRYDRSAILTTPTPPGSLRAPHWKGGQRSCRPMPRVTLSRWPGIGDRRISEQPNDVPGVRQPLCRRIRGQHRTHCQTRGWTRSCSSRWEPSEPGNVPSVLVERPGSTCGILVMRRSGVSIARAGWRRPLTSGFAGPTAGLPR